MRSQIISIKMCLFAGNGERNKRTRDTQQLEFWKYTEEKHTKQAGIDSLQAMVKETDVSQNREYVKRNGEEKEREREIPMLMVACREITSGERGVSFVTSSLLRSCSIKPRFAMATIQKLGQLKWNGTERNGMEWRERIDR